MGDVGEVFSHENTSESCTQTHKSKFFPYQQVSGRNGDHEWLRMTNAFILCDLLWKAKKGHAANREVSFNVISCMSIYVSGGRYNSLLSLSLAYNLVLGLTQFI